MLTSPPPEPRGKVGCATYTPADGTGNLDVPEVLPAYIILVIRYLPVLTSQILRVPVPLGDPL